MLYDAVERPGTESPESLREAYESELRAVVDAVGVDAIVSDANVDRATVEALADGESPELTVGDAAAILAAGDEIVDAEVGVLELRDHLLMGMTTGVLDVDTIAANIDVDLSGQEVQQALEGRVPMTLAQLAAIHQFVAERNGR
ncbi:MAG: DUF5791 family protein [Halobacteriota archaeon]